MPQLRRIPTLMRMSHPINPTHNVPFKILRRFRPLERIIRITDNSLSTTFPHSHEFAFYAKKGH